MAWEGGRAEGQLAVPFEGVVPAMLRRLKQTRSAGARKHYLAYMSDAPCPTWKGGRRGPEAAAARVGAHGQLPGAGAPDGGG